MVNVTTTKVYFYTLIRTQVANPAAGSGQAMGKAPAVAELSHCQSFLLLPSLSSALKAEWRAGSCRSIGGVALGLSSKQGGSDFPTPLPLGAWGNLPPDSPRYATGCVYHKDKLNWTYFFISFVGDRFKCKNH